MRPRDGLCPVAYVLDGSGSFTVAPLLTTVVEPGGPIFTFHSENMVKFLQINLGNCASSYRNSQEFLLSIFISMY